ncbi:MAG TPA: hypothetical protein VKU94_00005, partial [Geobacterales bacterium]|nr:hypothetical protein [Geobacterales bacterium]
LGTKISLDITILKLFSLSFMISSILIFGFFAKKKNLGLVNTLLGFLCLFFVFSFGFSPQYIMYVFVLLFLVLRPERFMTTIIAIQSLALLEYPFSLIFFYLNLLPIQGLLILFYSAVLLRDCVLLYIPIRLIRNGGL